MNEKAHTHLRIGEKVKIMKGSQKGKIGEIKKISKNRGLAFVKEENNDEEKTLKCHVSNLSHWDSSNKVSSRIGYKINGEKKLKYFKKTNDLVPYERFLKV